MTLEGRPEGRVVRRLRRFFDRFFARGRIIAGKRGRQGGQARTVQGPVEQFPAQEVSRRGSPLRQSADGRNRRARFPHGELLPELRPLVFGDLQESLRSESP